MDVYTTGSFNAYGPTTLSPTPSGRPVTAPNDTQNVENRPSWMSRRDKDIKRNDSFDNTNIPSDQKREKRIHVSFQCSNFNNPTSHNEPTYTARRGQYITRN